MKKITCALLCIIVCGILFNSCASSQLSRSTLKNPDSAFLACRNDILIEADMIDDEQSRIYITDPSKEQSTLALAIVNDKRSKEPNYRIVKIKPGLYRLTDPTYTFNPFIGLASAYRWELPADKSYIFSVRPGEVVYLGDFIIRHYGKTPEIELGHDLEACKKNIAAKFPEIEGFVWISAAADRDIY